MACADKTQSAVGRKTSLWKGKTSVTPFVSWSICFTEGASLLHTSSSSSGEAGCIPIRRIFNCAATLIPAINNKLEGVWARLWMKSAVWESKEKTCIYFAARNSSFQAAVLNQRYCPAGEKHLEGKVLLWWSKDKLHAVAASGRWMPGNTFFLWVQIVMLLLRHCQSEPASSSRSSDLPFTYFCVH